MSEKPKRGSKEFWAMLRPEFVACAMDSNGSDYAYTIIPQQSNGRWVVCDDLTKGVYRISRIDYIFNYDGLPPANEWRESLILRPREWHWPVANDTNAMLDDPVWVRHAFCPQWEKRYYAVAGRVWSRGYTSCDGGETCTPLNGIVLPDPDNPDMPPPDDYRNF